MNRMFKYPKILISIITGILFANLFLANFVFAQAGAIEILNEAEWKKAQANITACKTFSDMVSRVTQNEFRAGWSVYTGSLGLSTSTECRIIQFDFTMKADGITMTTNTGVSILADDMNKAVRYSSKGLDTKSFADTKSKAIASRDSANSISAVVGWILDSILSVVANFLGVLTGIAGGVLSKTLEYTFEVTTMPTAVEVGWTIVRDICNMFFILALIVIGLGTILRLKDYDDYGHLLRELIIMALLVNFSKVIAVTLMNVVNNLAYIFYNGGFFVDIVKTILKIANPANAYGEALQGGWMGALSAGAGKIVFMLVGTVIFIALAAMFVIRLVGLYILIIFSPIAYVARILPATKKYSDDWWSHFIKYLIWAPVALFMIRLTILVVKNDSQFQYTSGGAPDSSFTYFILSAFLVAAIYVAKQAGMVGGDMVVNGAKRAGAWVGHRAVGFAGRKWNEQTSKLLEAEAGEKVGAGRKALFAVLNPVAAFKGYEQRAHELKEMAQAQAVAGGREVTEQFLTAEKRPWKEGFGKAKLRIPYRQFVERQEENEFLKQYQNMRKESLMQSAVELEGMQGPEAEKRKRAVIKASAAQGYLDDLLRMKHFANQYADKDGTVYSAEVLNRFMNGYLGKGEQAMRFMAEDMEELGKQTKHYEYLGHAYFDPDSGTFKNGMEETGQVDTVTRGGQTRSIKKLKNTWQAGYASGELAKIGGRQRAEIAPHNIVPLRAEVDANGEFVEQGKELKDKITFGRESGEIDEFTSAVLTKIGDEATLRDIHFSQARTKDWVLSGDVDQNTGEVVVANEGEIRKIQALWKQSPEYVKAMYAQHTGLRREQVSGFRLTVYDRDPQGNVTNKRHINIGDPAPMKLPIAVKVADEVASNPSFQLSEDSQRKLRPILEMEVKEATLGNINQNQLGLRLTQKIQTANIQVPNLNNLLADIYDKMKVNIEAKYNPSSVIKEIDKRLQERTRNQPVKLKLNITQINALSSAVSEAVGEAYEHAAQQGVKLSQNQTELRNRINAHIQAIQATPNLNLPPLDPTDIDIFVQHAKPTQ